jgi:hypothetical protein
MQVNDDILRSSEVVTGARIPQHVIDSVLAALEPVKGPAPAAAAVLEKTADIVEPRPRPRDVVTSMLLGLDGTVWVTLPRTPDGVPMLVLDSEGQVVASLTVPHGWNVVQANLSHVWMSKTGERGLAGSVRYRVRRERESADRG